MIGLIVLWLWQAGFELHSFEYCFFLTITCVSSRSVEAAILPSGRNWDDAAGNNDEDWTKEIMMEPENRGEDKTMKQTRPAGWMSSDKYVAGLCWVIGCSICTNCDRISSANTFKWHSCSSKNWFPWNRDDFQRFKCQHCCPARCGNPLCNGQSRKPLQKVWRVDGMGQNLCPKGSKPSNSYCMDPSIAVPIDLIDLILRMLNQQHLSRMNTF